MASKKYKCLVELTTRLQTDGKRLTYYPGQTLEAKVLHKDQIESLLAANVIGEIKKTQRSRAVDSDAENAGADGS